MSDRTDRPLSTQQEDVQRRNTIHNTLHQESSPQELALIHPASAPTSWFRGWGPSIAIAAIAILSVPMTGIGYFFRPSIDPKNYHARAENILKSTPLIDGHNDLPHLIQVELYGKMTDGTFNFNDRLLGHTDIQRMRKGQMGGQFWSVFVECAAVENIDDPTWVVRDTLEQIDIARRFISEYPSVFEYCADARCARDAFKKGRIASMIGIEGGHQVGNSLGALRQMYDLGARYVTTTHNCDNAFGTAASTVAGGGQDKGLTKFGHEYVAEMNRLGMMIDLSHVSHQTMRDILSITRAPVIFSHSGAYSVQKHLRHVPDDVLRSIKKNGGIVMATFVTRFLNMKNPEEATIHDVVDHIFHIAEIAGWDCVGVGSDFSGTPAVPIGLEDVSKYPDLVALLLQRGATEEQVRLFAGDNLLRVWSNIELAGKRLQSVGQKANEAVWEERLETWPIGFPNSPFMYRKSRDRTRGLKSTPHYFNVDAKEGVHKPDNIRKE
ncbi:Dipeptidase [Venustampulla echinocandica]|uniref:Dipeptidase n=1 Tax=Venustampulla echinocandica TaxID=2656787 RepID=A0A370TXG8_9HELO|nr:Dipeptidase [Venustampulla echinocandica]RDL40199.1 Dipeptidase [Venustampulla echinocandica]